MSIKLGDYNVRIIGDNDFFDLEYEEAEEILALVAGGCYSGRVNRGRHFSVIWYV